MRTGFGSGGNASVRGLQSLAEAVGVSASTFDAACNALAGPSATLERAAQGRPSLNASGEPFQLLLSQRDGGVVARLLYDLANAHRGDTAGSRRDQAIARAFSIARAAGLLPIVKTALDLFEPTDHSERGSQSTTTPHLDCVLGMSLTGPGVALYLRTDDASQESAWSGLREWLGACCIDGSHGQDVIDALQPQASLAGVALEGIDPQRGRMNMKMYWRLRAPVSLGALNAPFVADPVICSFLNQAVGDRSIGLHALVFSTGFDLSTGAPRDGKVDVCGHCVPRALGEWVEILDHTAADARRSRAVVAPPSVPGERDDVAVEFVGMGVDDRGAYRLNIYCSERST